MTPGTDMKQKCCAAPRSWPLYVSKSTWKPARQHSIHSYMVNIDKLHACHQLQYGYVILSVCCYTDYLQPHCQLGNNTLDVLWAVAECLEHINLQLPSITTGDNTVQQISAPVLKHHPHCADGSACLVLSRISSELVYRIDDNLINVARMYKGWLAAQDRGPKSPMLTSASTAA